MTAILAGLALVLASTPLVTYLVYSKRRLDGRRKQLLQTLLTLGLEETYMKIRHGQSYREWKAQPQDRRMEELESRYFNADFAAETSYTDFLWPVALATLCSAVGWYAALTHVAPIPGWPTLATVVPPLLVWGFVGAFFGTLLSVIDEFRRYSLMPHSYYLIAYRLLFSSTAALLIAQFVPGEESPLPALVAFLVGVWPVEKTVRFFNEVVVPRFWKGEKESEVGADMAAIQGLEDGRNRQKLVEIGITSVQSLATADPLYIFFHTTFSIRTVVDMIDKAILHLYLGDKVQELRRHGINGVIELVALALLAEQKPAFVGGEGPARTGWCKFFDGVDTERLTADVARVLGQSVDELKAFIYNMYYDPVVEFIYQVWGSYLKVRDAQARQEGVPADQEGEAAIQGSTLLEASQPA